MIKVQDLVFAYGDGRAIFRDFNWGVAQGESWSVIGPSGCGKTTLLYLLAGLRSPNSGQIIIGDHPLDGPRRSTGLILQDYGLLPWATAYENVDLGMKIRGTGREHRGQAVLSWVKRLGIDHVLDHYPSQLSGGQRQRVAIARTLILDPDLLLMDEPFSSLDSLTREEMQDLVLALGLEGQVTTLLVTHNIEEAVLLGRKILVLGQPPNTSPQIVNNTGGGHAGYRNDPTFLTTCNEVRRRVQEAARDVAA
ncbi:MAG: ABC transporter ATP-binding protein [Chloroflexi bacterium]|nr:ABC transporter ATP-binding protein [Chloroflexota bacterium]